MLCVLCDGTTANVTEQLQSLTAALTQEWAKSKVVQQEAALFGL